MLNTFQTHLKWDCKRRWQMNTKAMCLTERPFAHPINYTKRGIGKRFLWSLLAYLFVWKPLLIYQVRLQNKKKIHARMPDSLVPEHSTQRHPHTFHGERQPVDCRVCWNHHTDPCRPGNWDKVLWKGKFLLTPVRQLARSGPHVYHLVWAKRGWKRKKQKKKLLFLANRKVQRKRKESNEEGWNRTWR